jgi:propanol-preferring alcohol dehydrogenase
MVLERQGEPLQLRELADPDSGPARRSHPGERDRPARSDHARLHLTVRACAVCRTDLHLRDSEIEATKLPVVLGHQIVATTDDGGRVGVPWLGWTDGECRYCRSGRENLCVRARFTGRDIDGGFAEHTLADERYCFALPAELSDEQAAPLLCGGLIGYRALRFTGDATRLGLYGFGSAAHMICQVAVHQGRHVFAFTRPGDERGQSFARSLGAIWAGASTDPPPEPLDAAIIFAADGALVPTALRALDPGGSVVCAGIHMSEIPAFSYDDLWGERQIRSVANLTRADAEEFLALAPKVPVRTTVTTYRLEQAEQALADLRAGRFTGSAVVVP